MKENRKTRPGTAIPERMVETWDTSQMTAACLPFLCIVPCGLGCFFLLPLPVTLVKFWRFIVPLKCLEENSSNLKPGVLWDSRGDDFASATGRYDLSLIRHMKAPFSNKYFLPS